MLTNAERLRNAARDELTAIAGVGIVGKMRDDRCARKMYDLIRIARFLDEPLPGVAMSESGTQWTGTGYSALKRVAR